ncbi:MAG: alkaline phosphatase family protein [Verrucomicrobiota bacterium]
MNQFSFLCALAMLASSVQPAVARGQAEHVVVVVWDGLRPDFVTPQYTPALYELAKKGTFFANNHSAYITSTEVNGAALATGMQPDHNGIMANTGYRSDFNWLSPYGTEALDVVRRGDAATGGHYLEAATVAEIVQQAGYATVIAGAKPVALLHDRSGKKSSPAQKASVTLFAGQTLPRSVSETLVNSFEIGPFPTNRPPATSSNTNQPLSAPPAAQRPSTTGRGGGAVTPDSWTTKALTRELWKKNVPKYSLLWLSEPDASQHESGVGSEAAISALESSDKHLASVIKALQEKDVLDRTDIFVVSDHGFSTINRSPDLIESLRRSKFTAGKQFQNPEAGDIMVINLGGSTSFYVFEHDEAVIRRLVAFLQGSDFAGVIFSALPVDGTFPLSQAHVQSTNGSPDVLVSMRWTDERNEFGAPGMIVSVEGKKGRGTHASLSPFDLHNTLIAAGPDFKKGFVSELPSGNIDVAPTVLSILGASSPTPMDGRVLVEAMIGDESPAFTPETNTREASYDLGFLVWRQYLTFTRVGSALYYEEGNGESRLKQPENYLSSSLQSSKPAVKPLKVSSNEKNASP